MSTKFDELIKGQSCKVDEYSPALLAYMGDAVFELYVRTTLIKGGNQPVNKLNRAATAYVKAEAQSAFYERIKDSLSEEETRIFKRGRNSKPATTAKNANIRDYLNATGVECLVGYLYLSGSFERLFEILNMVFE